MHIWKSRLKQGRKEIAWFETGKMVNAYIECWDLCILRKCIDYLWVWKEINWIFMKVDCIVNYFYVGTLCFDLGIRD